MNKKFLSAILFGALMVTSTGTFVSCKDYDDDIKDLQGQIDANKAGIEELKKLIGEGDYVTNVAKDGDNIVVSFKNAGNKTIELKDEVGSICKVENGELYIDNKATGIKVSADAPVTEFKPAVKVEDGKWAVLQEDGTYKTTGIPASGVTVAGSQADGFTLTIYDKDGKATEVKLPTAASAMTDLIVLTKNHAEPVEFKIAEYQFSYSGTTARDEWAGPVALPADGYIMAGTSTIPVQINPTSIDGTDVEFKLVDSKNNYPENLTLSAKAYTGLITAKSANANGLYDLVMEDIYFKGDATGKNAFMNQFKSNSKDIYYAITAGGSVRSKYEVKVASGTALNLEKLAIVNANNDTVLVNKKTKFGVDNTSKGTADNVDGKINANEWYSVATIDAAALYDMHLSWDKNAETLFGLEVKEEAGSYQFRATKTPDNITKAGFELIVETVSKKGEYKKATVWLGETSIITNEVVYDLVPYELKDEGVDKNYFSIDLAKMRTALGSTGEALWNTKAAIDKVTIDYLDADGKLFKAADDKATTGIDSAFVSEIKNGEGKNVTKLSEAKFLKFKITNATAANAKFKVNKQYTAVVTFKDAAGEELNVIKVPFKLTLPAITTLFEIDPGFINNGVASCYMYAADSTAAMLEKNAGKSPLPTFKLSRIFKKYVKKAGFTIALDGKTKVGTTDKTSAQLAYLGTGYSNVTVGGDVVGNTVANDTLAHVTLGTEYQNADVKKTSVGYGLPLNFVISGKFANAWDYPEDEVLTFKAAIMSPIKEGKIVPATGTTVTIKASDLNGYKFGNDVITGYTYNSKVTYKVLPNKDSSASTSNKVLEWSRDDVAGVKATSGNINYFTVENNGLPTAATTTKGIITDGAFVLKGYNVDHTVETAIEIIVTDIWGYTTTDKDGKGISVPVKITVNE